MKNIRDPLHTIWKSSHGSFEAKSLAALKGLGLCVKRNFSHFFLKIDSIIVFQMIEGKRQPNYKLNLTIEKILHMIIQA